MAQVNDPVIAWPGRDLGDVGNRVLKLLAGAVDDEPFILKNRSFWWPKT
jgi:hypothetical protein